jgi:diaminopimelate decarboxylase
MVEIPERVTAAILAAGTPVYVYDSAILRERAARLRAALPGATLLYAVKANGHPEVVETLAGELDGLEVASGGELALAVEAGALMIAFSGPAKTDAELRAAMQAGAVVHVESTHELRRISAIGVSAMGNARVAIRVNRLHASMPGTHRMTGVPTPFGVDEAELPSLLALARTLPGIELIGFHLHAVSNNLDAAAHAAFLREAASWADRTAPDLTYVNAGGGLGVDYTGTAEFDLSALTEAADGLVLEPGRYLAADAGFYAADVLDLKRTHGRWFAVLRGGTHHFRLPAAWGYSHPFAVLPVDDWPYPFARPEVRDTVVDAVGELCTPRDVLARDHPVTRLRAGDIVVLPRAGAYGWDISHHDFLRHPYPRMVVI